MHLYECSKLSYRIKLRKKNKDGIQQKTDFNFDGIFFNFEATIFLMVFDENLIKRDGCRLKSSWNCVDWLGGENVGHLKILQ